MHNGVRFGIIKATLAIWFKFHPATCRTYLLEDDVVPDEDSFYFDPPNASDSCPEPSVEPEPAHEDVLPADATLISDANPQEPASSGIGSRPAACFSWFCGKNGPPECFSFLGAPRRRSCKDQANKDEELIGLKRTVQQQQEVVDKLNKRLAALENKR